MNTNIEIRDEEMLLTGLSRLVFSQEHIRKIHDLIKSISDWDYFTSMANKHGISSLVFHNLEQLGFLSLFHGYLYRATIKEIPGIRKKVLFIIGDIFPGISFMKERYHCRSVWRAILYYPVRFGKIAFLFIK